MSGIKKMLITKEKVIEALQYHFDTFDFKLPPKIIDIKLDVSDYNAPKFELTLEDKILDTGEVV